MKIIKARPGDYINVGQAGEELARRVEFVITEFEDLYGPGVAQFLVQRMGDTEFYPVAITQKPGVVVWTVTIPENLVVGKQNKYQIRYYAGETLATSVIGQFAVNDGFVGGGGEVPEIHKGWTEQVLAAAVRAEEAEQRAEDAANRAEKAGNVFIAVYGKTTSAEIEAAYQSEKAIICKAAISKYIPVSDKGTITNRYQPTDTVTIIEAKFDAGMGQYLVTSAKTSNVISLAYGSTFVPGNVAAGDYISEYYVVESFWTNTYEVNGAYVVYTFVKSKVHGVENIFSDLTFAPLSARESATEHYFQGFSSRGNVQIACNADVWSFAEVFPTADLVPGAVSYASAQTLTDAQKAQARANIGAGTGDGTEGGTGFPYEIGHGLKVVDNATLEVDAVSDFEGDNTLPITAAAVQTTVGNIEIILATI